MLLFMFSFPGFVCQV